jgi:hypothetical protein
MMGSGKGNSKGGFLRSIKDEMYFLTSILLTIAGIILSLSPLFSRTDDLFTDSHLAHAIFDPEFENALLLSSVIAIPMAADLILDTVYVLDSSISDVAHWFIRIILIAVLTLPNVALYYNENHRIESTVAMYLCLSTLKVVTAAACIFMFTSIGNIVRGAGWKSVTILSFFILGQILLLYTHFNLSNHAIFAFAYLFLALAGFFFLYIFSGFLYKVWKAEKKLKSDEACFIFYFTVILLFSIIGLVFSKTYGSFIPTNYSSNSLASFEYLQMAFLVVIMILPGRILRFDLAASIRQMKERQAFVRYICVAALHHYNSLC